MTDPFIPSLVKGVIFPLSRNTLETESQSGNCILISTLLILELITDNIRLQFLLIF